MPPKKKGGKKKKKKEGIIINTIHDLHTHLESFIIFCRLNVPSLKFMHYVNHGIVVKVKY